MGRSSPVHSARPTAYRTLPPFVTRPSVPVEPLVVSSMSSAVVPFSVSPSSANFVMALPFPSSLPLPSFPPMLSSLGLPPPSALPSCRIWVRST